MATNVPEAEKAPVRRFARLPRLTLHLEDDRWVGRAAGEAGIVFSGRYTVKGDVVRFDLQECTSPGLCMRDSTTYAWSVYRNTLRFGRIGNDRAWPGMIAKPWTRVR